MATAALRSLSMLVFSWLPPLLKAILGKVPTTHSRISICDWEQPEADQAKVLGWEGTISQDLGLGGHGSKADHFSKAAPQCGSPAEIAGLESFSPDHRWGSQVPKGSWVA